MYAARVQGRIQLFRAGPRMDGLTFPGPGALVVRESATTELAELGVDSSWYSPVDKAHIIKLDIDPRTWVGSPPEDLLRGEPEDILLSRAHDEETANGLGILLELCPPVVGRGFVRSMRSPDGQRTRQIELSELHGHIPPIFRVEGLLVTFFREDTRGLLERTKLGGLLTFMPVNVVL